MAFLGMKKDKEPTPPAHVWKIGDSAWLKCSELEMTVVDIKDGKLSCAWHTADFALDMGVFPPDALYHSDDDK
jgi:hypothetical protein